MNWINIAGVLILLVSVVATMSDYPSNTTTLLQSYGYPVENFEVTTEDGYILSMQRVRKCGLACRGVVMFQHGLLDCSIGINLNEPHEDLMLMLADAGYDVFLGNNRGNGYSMSAVHFSEDTDRFWQFSFDEMARYDLPAQIRFALDTAKASQLVYIGHSEGTIQAFAGFLNHTVASWVKLYVALAPVGRVGNQKSEFLSILADLDTATIMGALGVRQFSLAESIHRLAPDICILDPSICLFIMDAIAGPTNHLNSSRQYYYVNYLPAGTSVRNMIHWSQMVKSKQFQMYDYGASGNMKMYGQLTPPLYDMTKFPSNLPTMLCAGGEDYLADPADVAWLETQLPSASVTVRNYPTYAHLDFLWSTDAWTTLYVDILQTIEGLNK